MNILLTCILCVNIAILAVILVIIVKVKAVFIEYRDMIMAFITPVDKDTPSPAAQVGFALADELARSLVSQVKSTFMGKASGEARASASLDADIAIDAASSMNPLIGSILTSFPALRKTLKKNPQLLDMAMSKLAGHMGGGLQPAQFQQTAADNKPRFKL